MGTNADDETLKILASIRINKLIDDFQSCYLAQQRELGYLERVLRDVLSLIFDISRRAVPDSVKLALVRLCLSPSVNVPIHVLLSILANLGPTQNCVHGAKHVASKKVPMTLQAEILKQIVKYIEYSASTIREYASIIFPILAKLMSFEYLRLHVSSLIKICFQSSTLTKFNSCRNKQTTGALHSATEWEYRWIRALHIQFPMDQNLRKLVEEFGAVSCANWSSSSFLKSKCGLPLFFLNGDTKRRKTHHVSSNGIQIQPRSHLSTSEFMKVEEATMKNELAILLCTDKLNIKDIDECLRITSFRDLNSFHHSLVNVLWQFRRLDNESFCMNLIDDFVLNKRDDTEWSLTFRERVNFIHLVKASVDKLQFMITNDGEKIEKCYYLHPTLYLHLSEKYLTEVLVLLDVESQANPQILNRIVPLLLGFTKFAPQARSTVARKILLLYRKFRAMAIVPNPSLTLPRAVVYFMLLHGDLNLLDAVCFHIAEEKKLHFKDDRLRRVQNSFTMDLVNMIWRERFFSFDVRRDSPHKALFLNPSLISKLYNSSFITIGLGEIGGILMGPAFAFIATKNLRRLEDEHNLDIRIEGPLTEENVTLMQADDRTQWLPLSRELIKLEILKVLDLRNYKGVCDMMFKSLKSLSDARDKWS